MINLKSFLRKAKIPIVFASGYIGSKVTRSVVDFAIRKKIARLRQQLIDNLLMMGRGSHNIKIVKQLYTLTKKHPNHGFDDLTDDVFVLAVHSRLWYFFWKLKIVKAEWEVS